MVCKYSTGWHVRDKMGVNISLGCDDDAADTPIMLQWWATTSD